MQNLFRFVLAFAAVLFVFGASSQIHAQSDAGVNELYRKMDSNLKTLTSLKTRIRMEKYNVQIKDFDDQREGSGMFIPIKNSKSVNFRLDWQKGANEKLSVVDGTYKLYQPDLEQVIIGKNAEAQKSGKASSIFKLINMSAKDLRSNFYGDWKGQEVVANVHSTYKLHLTPKTAMDFKEADVWVNADGMVVQIRVYENNGDWTNILLFDIQKNAKVSKKDLAVQYPKNTKEIKG